VQEDDRASFIQQVLVDDNRIWIQRDAPKVEDKFAVMAADRYDFMRGSVALHFADLARPISTGPNTRFLNSAEATTVLLFGDPHPENATVCRADRSDPEPIPPLTLEFFDLDATAYGPWTLDLRRLALGMVILTEDLPGCDRECQDEAIRQVADGYAAGLEPGAPVGATPSEIADLSGWSKWVEDLFKESLEEGQEQKRVNDYAPIGDDGARAFALGEETRLVALTEDETRVLEALLGRLELPPDFRRLAVARRLGSGVSSLVATRFVVLWDRGRAGSEDDALLQIREVIDPPVFPGRPIRSLGTFSTNHARVVGAARQLWSRPDADPRHVGTEVDGISWKTISWTSFFQDVNHNKIAEAWYEDELDAGDLAELAEDLGRVLAASHARTRTIDGLPARGVIANDLEAGGGVDALEAELLEMAHYDSDQLMSDHVVFVDLLDAWGPLLGAEQLVDGVVP
jgi:uncharacterized protein (DUF2252 family)